MERNLFKFLLVLQDDVGFFFFLNVINLYLSLTCTKVWLGIVGCIVGVIILLWILDRWSPYSYINNR